MGREQDDQIARQGRLTALVIAGTMLIWLAAQFIGPRIGLAGRYALLVDLLALAGFIWAFVNIYQIWRKRQNN